MEEPLPVDEMSFPLTEEIEAIGWVLNEVEAGRALPAGEAEAVVRSLSVAMHGGGEILMPLLRMTTFDEYTTAHALNVSVLAMALAEHHGLGGRDTRAIGVAGLLRDLGMTRVPKAIVAKAGPPTEEEWEIIRRHPADGARIILASEPQLDIAAVVAYEHHRLPDGSGYPTTHFPRDCHYATKLVQVCDVYDALRTRRFHRGAWTPESALRYVEEKSGSVFDAEVGKAFVAMMREWEGRMAMVAEGTRGRDRGAQRSRVGCCASLSASHVSFLHPSGDSNAAAPAHAVRARVPCAGGGAGVGGPAPLRSVPGLARHDRAHVERGAGGARARGAALRGG